MMGNRLIDALVYPLGWLINKVNPFPTDEYLERFVYPQVTRAKALGMPDEMIKELWGKAWNEADYWIVGRAPASLFARMIDEYEAEHNVKTDAE